MITLFLLEKGHIEFLEPGWGFTIAALEFITIEVPLLAFLIAYVRWSLL